MLLMISTDHIITGQLNCPKWNLLYHESLRKIEHL